MSDKIVPYISRINHEFGTRKNPYLLYVTKGGKLNSLIFHFKEDNKYYQYRQDNTNSNSVTLKTAFELKGVVGVNETSVKENCCFILELY